MRWLAFGLYLAALLADGIGAWLATRDLRARLRLLREFQHDAGPPTLMSWNTHPAVTAFLSALGPEFSETRVREGLNELIGALAQEQAARLATDDRLAKLVGVTTDLMRLRTPAILLVLGVVLGSAGNLVSAWPR